MELDSLKEILLKKAEGNENLQILIKYMATDFLAAHVFESLEKMATDATGRAANAATVAYGANLDNTDIMQLRDALSHHVSHYKGALKSMHAATDDAEKKRLREVADQHLNHLIPLMHLAAKTGTHSKTASKPEGKLKIEHPELAPWESNYTTLERNPNGRLKLDPKLLGARPRKQKQSKDPNKKPSLSIPDFRYLEMAPHHGHSKSSKMSHKGGYPWEEVQIGSPADIDAGKGFLHIEDVPDKKEYTPHPFEKHPIVELHDTPGSELTPERVQQFGNDLAAWKGSEHHKQWLTDQKAKIQADKEGYMKRGSAKSSHAYEGIPLLDSPEHVKTYKKEEPPVATPKAVAPTVRPAASKEDAVRSSIKIDALPEHLRRYAVKPEGNK